MIQKTKKRSRNQIKLYSDIILFVAFVLTNIPQTIGILFHEWISVLFIVPLMFHILLDWKWVGSVTKRVFKKVPGEVRFNHILDSLIFTMMVLALSSGFLISEAALPAIGIKVVIDPFWSTMHDLTANLTMVLIGVHLAMHWDWIVRMGKRHLSRGATPPLNQ